MQSRHYEARASMRLAALQAAAHVADEEPRRIELYMEGEPNKRFYGSWLYEETDGLELLHGVAKTADGLFLVIGGTAKAVQGTVSATTWKTSKTLRCATGL